MVRLHRATAFAVLLVTFVLGVATAPAAPVDVYLYNYAGVPQNELEHAMRLVSRVYGRSDVELRWSLPLDVRANPSSHPLQVVVMSAEMEATKASTAVSSEVFGSANSAAGRAWIFYGRVSQHVCRFPSNRAVLLAAVIAHELGHLLLPAPAHSRSGLMSPHWVGRIVQVPSLTPTETAWLKARPVNADGSAPIEEF